MFITCACSVHTTSIPVQYSSILKNFVFGKHSLIDLTMSINVLKSTNSIKIFRRLPTFGPTTENN